MYKQMAAYAAALLTDHTKFVPAVDDVDGVPVWFVNPNDNKPEYRFKSWYRLSVFGAMRAASDAIGADVRAYNSLDRRLRQVATEKYGKDIKALERHEAIDVLMAVAR